MDVTQRFDRYAVDMQEGKLGIWETVLDRIAVVVLLSGFYLWRKKRSLPVFLVRVSAAGLLAALLGDGVCDAVSWAALGARAFLSAIRGTVACI